MKSGKKQIEGLKEVMTKKIKDMMKMMRIVRESESDIVVKRREGEE